MSDSNELAFVLRMRDEASAVLKQHGAAMGEAAGQAKNLGAGHKEAAAGLNEVVGNAKEATEALVGLWATNEMVRGAIDAYEETDHALREIGAAADMSREQVEALHESMAAVSMTNGNATIAQMDTLATMAAKLGGSRAQIQQFSEALSKITTSSNLESVGKSVQQILSATGEGVEGVTKLADTLGLLGEKTRGGVQGLAQMTGLLASMTAGMNVSSETLAAYAATFDKIGGRPMTQAMQFNMVLQQIEKQARESGVGLKDLAERTGMTADEMTKLAQQHPDQVYEKMLEVVAKIKQGGGDPGAFLKEFGIAAGRQEQQIEALASKVDLLKKNLATAENPTGGANKYAEDMKNDFDKAVNEMTTAWTELKEQLGQDIFPAAIAGAKMLAGAIHEVTEFLKGMDGSTRAGLEAFVLITTSAVSLSKVFGLLGGSISGVTALFKAEAVASTAAGEAAAASATAAEGAAASGIASLERLSLKLGEVMLALWAAHKAGEEMGDVIKQQQSFGKQGITWGDEWHAGLASFGLESQDGFRKRMQAEKDSGQYRPGATVGRGETTSAAEDRNEAQRQQHRVNTASAAPSAPVNGEVQTGTSIEASLAAFDQYQKKLQDLEKEESTFNQFLSTMTESQKQQYASSIAAAQKELEVKRQALDPMNKMRDSWQEQLQAAQAYTKAEQDQAAIEKAVAEQRRSNPHFADADASEMRASMTKVQDAQRQKSFQEEVTGLQNQLALAGALTNTEKERLQIDQQIAALAKDKGYTQAQLDQLRQVLELTKQIEAETAQFKSLNPQAEAIQNYNEQLTILDQRLKAGTISQEEFNRERTKLNNDTLEARDPVGAIVQSQQEEIQQLGIIGQYREADLKSLQEITKLKKEGVIADDEQGKAIEAQITSNNRMIQDVKDTQQTLDTMTQDFGSGLSHAIGESLNGQKYAFDKFFASLGQKMMDQSFSYLSKQVEGALTGGGQGGLLGGLFGKAQQGTNALGGLAKGQIDKTLSTANMSVQAANVTINSATAAAGAATEAGTATGVPGALPPAGTPLAGVQSTAQTGQGGIGSDAVAAAKAAGISPYGDLSAAKAAFSGAASTGAPVAGSTSAFVNDAYRKALSSGMTDEQARISAAQASLESTNGKSAPGDNYFGMKAGTSWTGPTNNLPTHEFINGEDKTMVQPFRAYSSYDKSSQDHLAMMKKNWPDAANATTDDQALAGLHNGRYGAYATAGNYDDAMKQRLAYIKPQQADDLSKTIGEPSDQDQAFQAALRQSKQAQEAMAQTMKSSVSTTSQSLTSLDQGIGQLGTKATTATPGMTSLSSSLDQMLSSLTKGAGSPTAAAGNIGGSGGLLGGMFSGLFSLFHEGGLVGYSNTAMRAVSPAIFAGARRFHDGLGDDEFPAILQRGERVLTAQQDQRSTALMSRMADMLANTSTPAGTQHADSGRQNQGGHRLTMIVNTPNASSFRYSQPQIMAQTHASLQRMGAKHN